MSYVQILNAIITAFELLERIQRNGQLSAVDLETSIAQRTALRKELVKLMNEDPDNLVEQTTSALRSAQQTADQEASQAVTEPPPNSSTGLPSAPATSAGFSDEAVHPGDNDPE